MRKLLKDYDPKNANNADKIDAYFKCLSSKTFKFKDEKNKNSKEIMTFLLASNMTGTDMLKPYVIGKSQNPE